MLKPALSASTAIPPADPALLPMQLSLFPLGDDLPLFTHPHDTATRRSHAKH